MRVSSFLVVLLVAISFIYAGCEKSDQKTDTENETSTSEQVKEDISQTAEEAEEKVEGVAEDVVEKSEEMHQTQVEELNKKDPPEIAAELWNLIHTEGYQEHWKEWPAEDGTEANVKTYVNDLAYNALEKKEKELPPGSIIVKNKYNDQQQLQSVNASINLGGNNTEDGGWFWAEYSPDGSPLKMERGGLSMTE